MAIPVYLISGFLESGKTSFIRETISDEDFSQGEKTLVILTEEGLEELEDDFLQKYNAKVIVIDEEEDFCDDFLEKINLKYEPDRVLVECNGMWNMQTFYRNINKEWQIVQIITTINGSTFESYLKSMRSIIISHFQNADMVIINRCSKKMNIAGFRRSIKGANRNCAIYFEDKNGEIMEVRDEILPYDINSDLIEIDDDDYGLWYLDIQENPKKYDGKKIKVTGMYNKPSNYPEGSFVHGRKAMTCCEEDISFIGLIAICQQKLNLKDGDWISIIANVVYKENKEFGDKMDILLVEKIEKVEAPKNKLVTFS